MADFYQTGVVATLHRLGDPGIDVLEGQLERFAKQHPIALVLPALYAEFEKPAMEGILRELGQVRYVQQFVVSTSRATRGTSRSVSLLL